MAKVLEGSLVAAGIRFGLVVARFNSFVTEALLDGALDALKRHGADDDQLTVVRVPGSFEIPLICKNLVSSARFDAVIALGAVIRGSTSHYDLVCSEVAKGVATVGLDSGVPVIFGVITTDSIEQAIERAGTKAGNKGADAAVAAIEMVNLIRRIGAGKG